MKKVLWFLTGFATSVTITTGEGLLFALFVGFITIVVEIATLFD